MVALLSVWTMAVGDISLAALAFRFDVATTVRARAVVEPWTLSITAGLAYFVYPEELKSVARVQAFRDFLVANAQRWNF